MSGELKMALWVCEPDGEIVCFVYECVEGVGGDTCDCGELCEEEGWGRLCWRVLGGYGWQGDPVTSQLCHGEIDVCLDFRYVRLGNVELVCVRFSNVEFGDVGLGNMELFSSVVCGMSVIELL